MGFIKDNKNTFEVYLTDLGKEKFFNGGFKDAVTFFSLVDSDNNYSLLNPEQNVFDPTDISQQPISTINHVNTNKTSLGNGFNEFVSDVFTQTTLRGKLFGNSFRKRDLLGTKRDVLVDYVLYEPDLGSSQITGIVSFIENE